MKKRQFEFPKIHHFVGTTALRGGIQRKKTRSIGTTQKNVWNFFRRFYSYLRKLKIFLSNFIRKSDEIALNFFPQEGMNGKF